MLTPCQQHAKVIPEVGFMIKGTPELIAQRREEIINACEKLYQTMSFNFQLMEGTKSHCDINVTISLL